MDTNGQSTASPPTACVFCEIVAGRTPASIVHEDDQSLVAATIGPVNPGHLLVMPKEHVPYLDDLDDGMVAHLFTVAKRAAAAMVSLLVSGVFWDVATVDAVVAAR